LPDPDTDVPCAVVGAAVGGYAIGSAGYNAYTAPNADARDYYLGQGVTATALTALGIKGAGAANSSTAASEATFSNSTAARVEGAGSKASNFFKGTTYSDKVLSQMKQADYHGFPDVVKNFAKEGSASEIVGGDKQTYFKLSIPGSYRGTEGNFEFMKDNNGVINHRQFVPNE
jgi:hypothetical protein